MIRSGELDARQLVEDCLRQIETLDPGVNAFTHVAGEAALAQAERIQTGDPRPFAGVPIAIKDNRAVAGMPITMCSDLFTGVVPRHDSFLVRRLREAGFVIVGKTTLPEMGILPTTESRRFGPTHNPWAADRTPGGSSGGSAAAVAAGLVPIAHGNDGGGSIRIPAACCGLVGLKPARGRVSVGPEAGQSFLVSDGVLTRSVLDTAAALDVLAGYEPGDATWAPPPAAPYRELAARDPGRLRIGLALNMPLEGPVLDPACEAAARDGAALLEGLGHDVEEITPPWSGLDLLADFTRAFGPLSAMAVVVGARLARREPTEADVEPLTWEMFKRAREQDTLSLLGAQAKLESVARSLGAFLESYDAVVTPALAVRPVAIGEIHGRGPDPWGHYRRSGALHPVHGDPQRHRAAGDLPAALPGRGRSSDGHPADRPAGPGGCAAPGRAAAGGGAAVGGADPSGAGGGVTPGSAQSQNSAHRLGHDAQPLGVGGAAGSQERHLQQLRFVGGRERGRPAEQLHQLQDSAGDGHGDPDDPAAPMKRAQGELHDLLMAERVGAGEFVARPHGVGGAGTSREPRQHAVGDILGPDRLKARPARAGNWHHREPRHALQEPQVGIAGRVDDRGSEDRVLQRGLHHGPLGDRLGPHQSRAAAGGGPEGREEHEPLHTRSLGRLHQSPRGDPGQLLDRAAGLIADHRGEVHDRLDPPQGVPERQVIAEIAERDLDPSPAPFRGAADRATRQRTGVPAAVKRRSRARPTVPVAPVSSSTRREATGAPGP